MAVVGHSKPASKRVRTQGTVLKFSTEGVLRTTVNRRNTHVTDVTRDDRKMRVTTITRALRLQWKCKHDVLVSRHLAAGVIHSFPTPPAVGPPTPLTDMHALSNSRLTAVYLWLAIAKAVRHCPGRLKLFDAAKMRGAWRHQAASVVWASTGVERRVTWKINCWYRISHAHFTAPHLWC